MTASVVLIGKGRRVEQAWFAGETLYETSCRAGMPIPTNCRSGLCGTCVVRLRSGQVRMRNNRILTTPELENGYVLGCQSEPITPRCEIEW